MNVCLLQVWVSMQAASSAGPAAPLPMGVDLHQPVCAFLRRSADLHHVEDSRKRG